MKTFVVSEVLASGENVERYVDADGFRVDEDGNLLLWVETRSEGGRVLVTIDDAAVFPTIHWTSCVAQESIAKAANQFGHGYNKEPISNIHITLSSEEMAEQIEHFAKEIPHSWQG